MNKFMPPKPAFGNYENGIFIPVERFNDWYAKEITPLFENAVEVYGDGRIEQGLWSMQKGDCAINQTHRALLINIKPIKEETAEDIVKELANCDWTNKSSMNIVEKAKAYREKKEK
jgi:hypothetical protein